MAKVSVDLVTMNRIADEKAERGIRAAALQGEQILRADLLNRPGTGRRYGKHRASAPGETPAPDTGRLRGATQADAAVRSDSDGLVGRIVSNTEYAAALEKGAKNSARSLTAEGLRSLNTEFNQANPVYGPARLSALQAEVGTERTAARPFLSRLKTEFALQLRNAFISGAKA